MARHTLRRTEYCVPNYNIKLNLKTRTFSSVLNILHEYIINALVQDHILPCHRLTLWKLKVSCIILSVEIISVKGEAVYPRTKKINVEWRQETSVRQLYITLAIYK